MKMDARRAFQRLADSLSREVGGDFFVHLVERLAVILNADALVVAVPVGDGTRLRTLVLYVDGECLPNIEYVSAGTPCHGAMVSGACSYTEDVCHAFPDDQWLREFRAQAYSGVPMHGPDGELHGVLVALYRHPLRQQHLVEEVLRIAGARCGAELSHQRTERKLASTAIQLEATNRQLQRTHRALTLLRLVNRAVIRLTDEMDVLEEVCRLAVDQGSYRYAWAGLAQDAPDYRILPLASAGGADELLRHASFSWDADGRHGQGPSGRAIREDVEHLVADYADMEHYPNWVQRFGVRAEIALPLHLGSGRRGVMVLLMDTPYRASDGELALLRELAGNLSFGLQAMRAHQHQRHTQQAVLDMAEVVTARSDDAFFSQFVRRLAKALGADGVFVSRVEESVPLQATLLAGLVDGQPVAPFHYCFEGLPCDDAFRDLEHVIARGVSDRYPRAQEMIGFRVEAYVGRRLEDASGDAIGTLFVLFREPLHDPEPVSHLLRIFAAGASAELERRRSDAHIRRLAFFDPGTGLPNRANFMECLQSAIALARTEQHRVALMFLDLNRFKEINDSQGHDVGDQVLKEVAARFSACLGKQGTLARLGGDEFVVMVERADEIGTAQVVGRLLSALNAPVVHDRHRFNVEVSIGVAFFPEDGDGPRELLKHTDIAMYHAKESRSGYRFYAPEMGRDLRRRLVLAARLDDALAGERLELCFQPSVALGSGALVGAEVLCRWFDAELGWVSPSEFVTIAEERGMIEALGSWVMERACRQLKEWQDASLTRLPHRLHVNLAAAQFEDPDLAKQLTDIASRYGISPQQLGLEITESGFMKDPEQAVRITDDLRQRGFSLSIDDFGTGYSSLAYLKRFAVEAVKIDMSFVSDMLTDSNDHAIVATIIAMARQLGLTVVAEGIETAAQLKALRDLGCDHGQGYLLSRPLSSEEFAQQWLMGETSRGPLTETESAEGYRPG
ncbi:EAL domain-containing protein [Halomonas denitrificans]|uniref:sensor domain-containing phosphodiesterase n=1 Tax=Halomonas denitrificans TaxID=370769 RepID=UPI001C99DDA2|nr:EAL domain-containing protein [Halomonas denitrificans]MBY5967814.1 EAL domain-containing protein [Halomonas denitrificans]